MITIREIKGSFDITFGKVVKYFKGRSDLCISELYNFCRMGESSFSNDSLHMARIEGRREVFLFIKGRLGLTDSEIEEILKDVKEKIEHE